VDDAKFELNPRSLERSLDGLMDGLLGEVDALILGHSADSSAAAVPSSPSTSPRRGRASPAASGSRADPTDDEDDAMSTI
jgi:hypothetical protein